MGRLITAVTAYNIAGEVTRRPKFLKNLIISRILFGSGESMSETLARGVRVGYKNKLDKFLRWSHDRSQSAYLGGLQENIQGITGGAKSYVPLTTDALEYQLGDRFYGDTWPAGNHTYAGYIDSRADIDFGFEIVPVLGPAQYLYWAHNYFVDHYIDLPGAGFERINTPWTVSYSAATNTITMVVDGGSTVWSFTADNYDSSAQYLYILTGSRYLIYKLGSGDPLYEAIATNLASKPKSSYYPSISIRTNNTTIGAACAEQASAVVKGFKKATGQKITDLETSINDSPSAVDIDNATLIFGIQANTTRKECLRYIFEYCRGVFARRWQTSTEAAAYALAMEGHYASIDAWRVWRDAGSIGTAPTISAAPSIERTAVNIFRDAPNVGGLMAQFETKFEFDVGREESGAGLQNPSAVVGHLWWENLGTTATLYWQTTTDQWKALVLVNAKHGKPFNSTFNILLVDNNLSSGDSAFLFPLHKESLKSTGLIGANQVVMESLIVVTNSYVYIDTSSILSGIVLVVVALLIIAFPPSAASLGLLGSNAAVGVAIGLTGTLAIIAGAVANFIAAIILTKIITMASVAVFGEKLGQIIGAVVGFVTTVAVTGISNGLSLTQIWGNLGSAANLLQLTNAVGSGISGYVQASIQELNADMVAFSEKAESESRKIDNAFAENIGYASNILDPMGLTNSPLGYSLESPSQFLSRTTLTGSDIADISLGMISNFTRLTLNTDLPG